MGRNPVFSPLQYATPQFKTGPPATYTTAQRLLNGYDYGELILTQLSNSWPLTSLKIKVIVGAGAAGCVLASKLSEDPKTSVLVLEAGGDNTNILRSMVPLMFPTLYHTKHDWDYYTSEQPGLASRRLYWPRGRMLGGSTSMNAMIYHHASKSDFDEWAVRYGCEGWSYDDLQPYFRAMERFIPNAARPAIDVKHRGDKGHWVTGYSWLSEIGDKGFLPACEDVGIPLTADINTPEGTLGSTRLQTFIDAKGQRSSLATAYLTPEVRKRSNLTIACGAQVTRLLVDRLSDPIPTIIGVEFQTKREGRLFEVHARKEVILSGGAINTPQILLLSGIGPEEELNKHGIPIVKVNESVGKNLKDHLVPTTISCKAKPGTTLDYLGNTLRALPALARWLVLGSGPLTHNAGEAAAFIRSFEHQFPGRSTPRDNTSGKIGPDVEIVGAPMAFINHGEEPAPPGVNVFTLGCCCLRPQSKGTVTLQSKDAFEPRKSPSKDSSSQILNDNHSAHRPQLPL